MSTPHPAPDPAAPWTRKDLIGIEDLSAAELTLEDDPRADAAYRRQITKAMVARALRDAASRVQA